ncbi:hypothetical protein CDD83_4489 [Cordyceps sp. RAO-2017]|nr:hypothetical protein CDD83_4489 [Cordyceps sp. RAO-2017]
MPIPTISAVASIALGGGFELALATHFRVMATTAVVGLPETRLAIIPGAGGTHRLPPLVGPARARDLILTGRRVHGPEAFFLGLADRLVELGPVRDDKDLEEEGRGLVEARERTLSEAVALAHDICKGGLLAVRAALRAVARPSPDNEARQYQSVVATRDRDEALEAFAERRPPKFQGV